MKKQLLFLCAVMLLAVRLAGQDRQVTGTVTDAAGKTPLPEATVSVPGTPAGTTTDNNGHFTLRLPTGAGKITVSMLNYASQTLDVTPGQSIEVFLHTNTRELDETVVVGYGRQKKKDLTGAVATISAKDVGGRQTLKVSDALQGAMAGVSVTRSSGSPGGGSSILIRGITTIGTNGPLVIVDGVPVSSVDNVNPNDVESLSVLKDAASASIYGSRGAAGVILITTKRAGTGRPSLEYNYEYGAQKPTAMPKYVGPQDYMRYFNEQAVNDGAASGAYAQPFIDSYLDSNRVNPDEFPVTDWQKTLLRHRTAPRQRHEVVFTSGTDKLKTKASLSYSKAGAFYDNYDFERYLLRVNNDLQINSKLSAGLDIFYKRTEENSPNTDPIYLSRIMPGIYDDYYSDGRFAISKDGRNPAAQLYGGGFNRYRYNQIGGRLLFNFRPVDGLTLTAQVAPTFDMDKFKNFSTQIKFTNPNGSPSTVVNQPRTTLGESRNENISINGQLLANYARSLRGGHDIDVLAGYEENYNNYESLSAGRSGFPLTGYPYLNAGSIELRTNSGAASESALRSFFGRLKYAYKGKYLVQGNLRYDKSSRFGKAYRGAVFPSVSAGWTVSEESFLKGVSWLSFLKVRGSWGEAGNERIGNYPYQATLDFTNALFYQSGGVVPLSGAGQQVYAVENISWETTRTSDIGIDAAFLDSRLNISAGYFKKSTFDILLPLDIPLYIGYDKPNQNAGTLHVKGWELDVNWRDQVGKVRYSIGANFSDARSRIGDLKGTEFRGDQIIRNGSEYNEWFGYVSNGLFQTAEEVTAGPVMGANTKPGDVRYMDMNKDGVITPDDKVLLGGALPRYLYGGNVRADYMGFDAGLTFQGVGKKLSRLGTDIVQPFAEAFGNVPQEMVGRFWSKNNTAEQNLQATYPRLSRTSNGNNYTLSDYWLRSGAYFRLKNATLGYTLREELLKTVGVQSLRVYLSANDFLSISKLPKYLDPEAGSYSYPIVATFMVGAIVKF
ncbi:SusC/RagA family TonB-linked outer membrane protein [Chitinophaga rhizosphaerae]|uniref:SusC/RagA family TonB-linked outer membrane protein n=1 Tax=Chitinophaga rhizosphaerae TaxID=1864947 RepID=UPI000F80BF15|nr:TonB-dependent receptor [Chitinophaga rhizosphaerae]